MPRKTKSAPIAQAARSAPEPDPPATAAARRAGLRYVSDTEPGIRRRRAGKSFVYRDAGGRPITNERGLRRIRSLAIPPAYADVWICADPNGHIQATGRDARGRKQYKYHPEWRATRDESKFARLADFAHVLPAIRRRVRRDLRQKGLGREKVLASVLRLLETTLIRIGNEEYARENKSFGLTTLRNRHVEVKGHNLAFEFIGKGGKPWKIELSDPRLARVVKSCQELPGQELFQYLDETGARRKVSSDDVNAYIREAASGQEFSAKDFRTWAGTVLAGEALKRHAEHAPARAKRCVKSVIEAVAARLGNTVAICRKCYIHPAVFEAFLDSRLRAEFGAPQAQARAPRGLAAREAAALALIAPRRRRAIIRKFTAA